MWILATVVATSQKLIFNLFLNAGEKSIRMTDGLPGTTKPDEGPLNRMNNPSIHP
jgi:hypothetical protein